MLKLKFPKPSGQDGAIVPPSPSEPATPSGIVKLKLKASHTLPTNSSSQPADMTASPDDSSKKKPSKKRAAEDSIPSPAVKRVASAPTRKFSLKLNTSNTTSSTSNNATTTPKPKLALKRKSTIPKIVQIRAKGQPPPRIPGVGYDSEDSETEKDPAIQQGLILRMQPGEDAEYIREAIATGRIGPQHAAGDAEVSLKFVEEDYRRAVVKVRGRMYAAVLVELPCIVETMKSFDRKGWWKVADVAQMLLVLGKVGSEEEARHVPLPREVEKGSWRYAHGITPPMHWVRKRRFRKRLSYNQIANVEDEVERLLAADKQYTETGGTSSFETMTREEFNRMNQEPQYGDADADADADGDEDDGDAIETTEMDGHGEYDDEEMMEDDAMDVEAMEAEMLAEFNSPDVDVENDVSASPAPIMDQAASQAAVEHAVAETPAEATQDEESDEDESEDDADSPDVVDEDAAAQAAERAQQLEEVADLEREVERAKQKVAAMTNQLLRAREAQKLKQLEEDLRVKRQVFGLDDDEDEDEDED